MDAVLLTAAQACEVDGDIPLWYGKDQHFERFKEAGPRSRLNWGQGQASCTPGAGLLPSAPDRLPPGPGHGCSVCLELPSLSSLPTSVKSSGPCSHSLTSFSF